MANKLNTSTAHDLIWEMRQHQKEECLKVELSKTKQQHENNTLTHSITINIILTLQIQFKLTPSGFYRGEKSSSGLFAFNLTCLIKPAGTCNMNAAVSHLVNDPRHQNRFKPTRNKTQVDPVPPDEDNRANSYLANSKQTKIPMLLMNAAAPSTWRNQRINTS